MWNLFGRGSFFRLFGSKYWGLESNAIRLLHAMDRVWSGIFGGMDHRPVFRSGLFWQNRELMFSAMGVWETESAA